MDVWIKRISVKIDGESDFIDHTSVHTTLEGAKIAVATWLGENINLDNFYPPNEHEDERQYCADHYAFDERVEVNVGIHRFELMGEAA